EDWPEQRVGVAAGAGRPRERFVGRQHARRHAGQVADLALQTPIEADEQVNRALLPARDRGKKRREERTGRLPVEKSRELLGELRRIGEWKSLRVGLDEEVKRIDHGKI